MSMMALMFSEAESTAFPKVQFTQEMKDAGYTILCPQMAPIHFDLLVPNSPLKWI